MNHELLLVAERTLTSELSTPALKTVAAETLVAASREGLPLHPDAIRAVWRWLVTSRSNTPWSAAECIGATEDAKIREEAICLLRAENTGREVRSFAAEVLAGEGHALRLDDRVLLDLVDRARSADDVRAVVRVVSAIHAARVVDAQLLRDIRERWASSSVTAIREEAVTFEPAPLDREFVGRMLLDEAVPVRAALARRIEWTEKPDDDVVAVVTEHIEREQHPEVQVALLHAQATLVDGGNQSRKRRRSA